MFKLLAKLQKCFYKDVNASLRRAAKKGSLYQCKYFVRLEANDFNGALLEASDGGHLEICKYLVNLGANDFNGAFSKAALKGYYPDIIFYYLLEKTNFDNNGIKDILEGVISKFPDLSYVHQHKDDAYSSWVREDWNTTSVNYLKIYKYIIEYYKFNFEFLYKQLEIAINNYNSRNGSCSNFIKKVCKYLCSKMGLENVLNFAKNNNHVNTFEFIKKLKYR